MPLLQHVDMVAKTSEIWMFSRQITNVESHNLFKLLIDLILIDIGNKLKVKPTLYLNHENLFQLTPCGQGQVLHRISVKPERKEER